MLGAQLEARCLESHQVVGGAIEGDLLVMPRSLLGGFVGRYL
jgi:hypothetical protein